MKAALVPLALLFPLVVTVLFLSAARPVVHNAAVYRGKTALTELLQETVLEILPADTSYADFVSLRFDDAQRVTAIEVDSAALSRFQAGLIKSVNDRLLEWSGTESSVPLGTLSGNWFFMGRGPRIKFYTVTLSAVTSDIRHKFEAAGINQTRHTIELLLTVDAVTMTNIANAPFEVTTSVPISDTVIVGVTPQMFAQMASGKI